MARKPISLSVSKITTYKMCPKKYYYRYIKKLPVSDFWAHLIIGNFVHGTLEAWTRRVMKGENAREAMVVAFRDMALSPDYKHKVEKFLPDIRPWLKAFVLHYEEQKFEPLTIEEEFKFKYRNIIMVGRIDRIDRVTPSKVKIVDYKTTKNPNYLTNMQLAIYNVGVKYGSLSPSYGKKDIETCYVLLRHNMKEITCCFSDDELGQFLDETEEIADRIASDTTWAATPSNLCQCCDFFIPCTQREEATEKHCDESWSKLF